jgi:DNA-directed RNA polymerase specialized sigma24 family protein
LEGSGPGFCPEQISQLYPRVLKLARHLVKNPADAEEVVQEALLKAFQHHRDYRREAPFSA